MGSRVASITGSLVLSLGMALTATAQDMRIQFAERVTIGAAPGHTEFDAYGRRFSLDLQSNDRLLKTLVANRKMAVDSTRLVRGTITGVTRSWVRLAKVGDGIEGAIWDGRDLYIVTTRDRIAANLTLPLDGAPSQTVIYRLSDTIGALPKDFCGVGFHLPASPSKAQTGLEQYQAMVSELRTNAAALPANEQLDISLIADTAFQNRYGSVARDEVLARINTVDGIFGEQVGVLLVPTEIRMIATGSEPFPSTAPETMLNQLATYRNASSELKASGLTHLLTGKDLDGDVIGIAYIDALCEPSQGASLSDSEFDQFGSALVMAHEIGHNFGAPHDGAAGSGCESTPETFLMAPSLNYSTTFSQCSLSKIQSSVERARGICVKALHYADLSLQLPDPGLNQAVTFNAGEEFSFSVVVHSIGNVAAENASLRVELPQQIAFQRAVLSNGSCIASGTIVTCALGNLAAGEDRTVDLRLLSGVLGSWYVNGKVSADNDYIQSNNAGTVIVGLQSAVDLGVVMTASASQVFEGDPIDFTIDVSSTRSQTAHGGELTLALGATVLSFSSGAHACATSATLDTVIHCDLADIPGGTSARITVHARALDPRIYFANASVSIPNDGDYANNNGTAQYTVRAEREVVTTVSSEELRVVSGSTNELVYTLTSAGRLSVTDVTMMVSGPAETILSIVPSAGVCAPPAPGLNTICDFGTLNAGETRTVTVRFTAAQPDQLVFVGMTEYTKGAVHGNSAVFTRVFVNVRIDAQAGFFIAVQVLEGQTGTGIFELRSEGIDAAQNVVATLDVPTPVRLTAVRLPYNPQGFQCTIVTPQRARCTGSFGQAPQAPQVARAEYDFVSDAATEAHPTLALTADGDEIASNNSVQTTLTVNPLIQVGLSAPNTQVTMVVGHVSTFDMTFTTGRNPVHDAYISVSGSSPWYAVDSIRFNDAECPRASFDTTTFGRYVCAMGDLPANSSYPVTVRYRGYQGGVGGGMFIEGGAQGAGQSLSLNFNVGDETDLQVQVAQTTATAASGTELRYPLITVWSMGSLAYGVDVDIPLPAFTTLNTVSSNGTCTGTTTLRCHFNGIGGGTGETIEIRLNTSASGTFTSNIAATAGNDFSATNNAASVALSVTAAPGGGSSSGGGSSGGGSSSGSGSSGGGGGGRMEWLALAFLGLLAARRLRRRDASSRPARAIRHQLVGRRRRAKAI